MPSIKKAKNQNISNNENEIKYKTIKKNLQCLKDIFRSIKVNNNCKETIILMAIDTCNMSLL